MSLHGDLKELEAAQHAEILYLHRTYLRTKREVRREIREAKRTVQRTLSPGRLIRKNPSAAIGIGALLGFLLAPSGASSTKVEVAQEKPHKAAGASGVGGAIGRMMRLLKHFMPRVMPQAPAPPAHEGEPAGESPEQHSGPAMIETLIASVLGSLKIEQLVGGWVRALAEKLKSRMTQHHEGNGRHHPESGDAPEDAGVPKSDRFNFGQG